MDLTQFKEPVDDDELNEVSQAVQIHSRPHDFTEIDNAEEVEEQLNNNETE